MARGYRKPPPKPNVIPTPPHRVSIEVSIRFGVDEVSRLLDREQLQALFRGLARVVAQSEKEG